MLPLRPRGKDPVNGLNGDHSDCEKKPEDERLEHVLMEVWFRSFSFLLMGDL